MASSDRLDQDRKFLTGVPRKPETLRVIDKVLRIWVAEVRSKHGSRGSCDDAFRLGIVYVGGSDAIECHRDPYLDHTAVPIVANRDRRIGNISG